MTIIFGRVQSFTKSKLKLKYTSKTWLIPHALVVFPPSIFLFFLFCIACSSISTTLCLSLSLSFCCRCHDGYGSSDVSTPPNLHCVDVVHSKFHCNTNISAKAFQASSVNFVRALNKLGSMAVSSAELCGDWWQQRLFDDLHEVCICVVQYWVQLPNKPHIGCVRSLYHTQCWLSSCSSNQPIIHLQPHSQTHTHTRSRSVCRMPAYVWQINEPKSVSTKFSVDSTV